jgi:hypothetical protein
MLNELFQELFDKAIAILYICFKIAVAFGL